MLKKNKNVVSSESVCVFVWMGCEEDRARSKELCVWEYDQEEGNT